jgi:two-component system NtrC family sensor kinase
MSNGFPAELAGARAVLDTVPLAILAVDRDGRISWVNRRLEEMFAYPAGELVGQSLEVLVPERFRAPHSMHRAGFFSDPRVRPMGLGLDLTGRRKDGGEFPVEISLSFVGTGQSLVGLGFINDITLRKEAERELARQRDALYQSEKLAALGQLVAGVAHEMNNPLGIMSSRIELTLADAEGQHLPAQLLEDLRVLHRNTLRVARVAQALRSFARQSGGEQRPVSLNRVVEETLLLAGKPMSTDNIQIATALDPELPMLLGDANALQQVLLNLLTNSREAMTTGGQVRIETGPAPERPGRLRLVVTDTGPGIAPADLPHIFEPFYTTKPAGTGLGLAVSYGIVQDHHGTIEAQSAPGRGTAFVLTFPALETPARRD